MDTTAHNKTPMSVLYVDDDPSSLNILTSILTMKYPLMKIHSAVSGEAGLESFKKHSQNIIILDIGLPQMDGIQLATDIKRMNDKIQIIILSAHAEKDYQPRLNDVGISHYIQKPITFDQVYTAVEDAICLLESPST